MKVKNLQKSYGLIMNLKRTIFLLIILLNIAIKSQTNNYIISPEVWSTPKEIAAIPS